MKVQHQAQRKWESTTIPLEEMRAFLTTIHDASFRAKGPPEVGVEVTADQGQYGKGAMVWLTARWTTGQDEGDGKPPDLSESLE